MTIEINRPEIDALIRATAAQRCLPKRGRRALDALEIQGEREAWLRENKQAINAKIEYGRPSSTQATAYRRQLGERLEADKQAWLATARDRETVPRCAGRRGRPQTDLALPFRRRRGRLYRHQIQSALVDRLVAV